MELVFKLSQNEAQLVLNALAKEPYGVVFSLISKIQSQAAVQLSSKQDGENNDHARPD